MPYNFDVMPDDFDTDRKIVAKNLSNAVKKILLKRDDYSFVVVALAEELRNYKSGLMLDISKHYLHVLTKALNADVPDDKAILELVDEILKHHDKKAAKELKNKLTQFKGRLSKHKNFMYDHFPQGKSGARYVLMSAPHLAVSNSLFRSHIKNRRALSLLNKADGFLVPDQHAVRYYSAVNKLGPFAKTFGSEKLKNYKLGVAAFKKGEYDLAKNLFLKTDYNDAKLMLAKTYYKLCKESHKKSIEYGRNNKPSKMKEYKKKTKEYYVETEQYLKQSAAMVDKSKNTLADTYYWWAKWHLIKLDYRNAILKLNNSLEYAALASSYFILGKIRFKMGDYKKAKIAYKKIMNGTPNLMVYYKVGNVYLALENIAKADEFFLKTIKMAIKNYRNSSSNKDRYQQVALKALVRLSDNVNFSARDWVGYIREAKENGMARLCAYLYKRFNLQAAKIISGNFYSAFQTGIDEFGTLFNKYARSVVSVLSNQDVTQIQGVPRLPLDRYSKKVNDGYKDMAAKSDILPLLELAKLASFGHHRLATVLSEKGLSTNSKLEIKLDNDHHNVSALYLSRSTDCGTAGLYNSHSNIVYVACKSRSSFKILGTIIHELCHFLMLEVYDNHCKPYYAKGHPRFNQENINRYSGILSGIKRVYDDVNRRESLPGVYRTLFDKDENNIPYYTPEKFASELIVRMPQLIVQGKKRKIDRIPELKELYDYYRDITLVDIKAHTEKFKRKQLVHGFSQGHENMPDVLFSFNEHSDEFETEEAPETVSGILSRLGIWQKADARKEMPTLENVHKIQLGSRKK